MSIMKDILARCQKTKDIDFYTIRAGYILKDDEFETLKGLVLKEVWKIHIGVTICHECDVLVFTTINNEHYIQYHTQSCCESVEIESIVGDLNDLIGSEILLAEEVIEKREETDDTESSTWSFYKLATIKGYVDIRWIGSSNGCYSEECNLYKLVPIEKST